jgi:hypothetical protein
MQLATRENNTVSPMLMTGCVNRDCKGAKVQLEDVVCGGFVDVGTFSR